MLTNWFCQPLSRNFTRTFSHYFKLRSPLYEKGLCRVMQHTNKEQECCLEYILRSEFAISVKHSIPDECPLYESAHTYMIRLYSALFSQRTNRHFPRPNLERTLILKIVENRIYLTP